MSSLRLAGERSTLVTVMLNRSRRFVHPPKDVVEPLVRLAAGRLETARCSASSAHKPPTHTVHIKVDDRRREEREGLAEDQATHDGYA